MQVQGPPGWQSKILSQNLDNKGHELPGMIKDLINSALCPC